MIRVLIPVYNEEKNIETCIKDIDKSLMQFPHRFYLINDGSKDGSLAIINKIIGKFPIKLINHKTNNGVAEALKAGLSHIDRDSQPNDILAIMEGDGTSTPTLLPRMIKKVSLESDIVIASRYVPGGMYVSFPFHRLILSRCANLILRFLYPYLKVSDYTIFYRVYRMKIVKDVLQKYQENLIKTRYFTANSEFLIKCISLRPIISEIPYVYDYGKKRGHSGLKIIKNVWQYLKLIYEHSILRKS